MGHIHTRRPDNIGGCEEPSASVTKMENNTSGMPIFNFPSCVYGPCMHYGTTNVCFTKFSQTDTKQTRSKAMVSVWGVSRSSGWPRFTWTCLYVFFFEVTQLGESADMNMNMNYCIAIVIAQSVNTAVWNIWRLDLQTSRNHFRKTPKMISSEQISLCLLLSLLFITCNMAKCSVFVCALCQQWLSSPNFRKQGCSELIRQPFPYQIRDKSVDRGWTVNYSIDSTGL